MSRVVLQVFQDYQNARTTFVQSIAQLAARPQNIEALQNSGVMAFLRPLLLDTVPSIQQSAAMAIGRLANYSEALAESVVSHEVLPQLVYSLSQQNRFYKKTAAFVLRSVAKHSAKLATAVFEAGALDALVKCLQDFEPSVKESAAWALGYIARHTPELAKHVVDANAVAQLVLCVQEPEVSLKRIAASTLGEICKHSTELAQQVVDAGAVPYLSPLIQHQDARLKRQVCMCLSHIAKHSVDLAEVVVEAEVFPRIFLCLKDQDLLVERNAATLIREVSKHTPELAENIVNSGGHGAIIEYCNGVKGSYRLPGLMTLGYIGACSETLALAVISHHGIETLKAALVEEEDDVLKAAAAWSLGHLGRHTPDHARYLAESGVLSLIVDIYADPDASQDLKAKCKDSLKVVIEKCTHLTRLEPLLKRAPLKIVTYVVHQFAKVLPNSPKARKAFLQSQGLRRIQELKDNSKSKLQEYIAIVNSCYPREIIQFYAPNFESTLAQKLDEYEAKGM